MKLVQYWMRRELNSFSWFWWLKELLKNRYFMVTLTIRGRSFTPTNPFFKEFPWWDRWGWFRDTVTLTMMVTSIKYSAGLSRGPGPIRNCISSPWELQLFREGTLLLLLWSFVNNNTMMIISQWLQRDDSIYDNDDDDDDKKTPTNVDHLLHTAPHWPPVPTCLPAKLVPWYSSQYLFLS